MAAPSSSDAATLAGEGTASEQSMSISIEEFSQLQQQILGLREELYTLRERNKQRPSTAASATSTTSPSTSTTATTTTTSSTNNNAGNSSSNNNNANNNNSSSNTTSIAGGFSSFFGGGGTSRDTKELEELRSENTNLKRLLQQNQQESSMKQAALQDNIKSFAQENDDLQQQIVQLQKQLATDDRAPTDAMQERIRQLEADVSRYRSEIAQLQSDSSTFVGRLSERDLELDALRERLDTEKAAAAKLAADQVTQFEQQKTELQRQIDELQASITASEKAATEKLKLAEESHTREAEFEELLTLKSQTIHTLRAELQQQKDVADSLQDKVALHRSELDQQIALLQEVCSTSIRVCH
jgi:regulator of replication initiation timing